MKIVKCFFCILLLLLLTQLGAGVPRRQAELKRTHVSVKGRIVGYSFASSTRMLIGTFSSPPHDEFLFMVEEGNKELEKLKYIKIRYRVTPKHHEDLPESLFTESGQRSFVLERDETCDESARSFIRGHTFETEKERARTQIKYQNLQRLPRMEKLPLPEKGTFRCYSFGWNGTGKQLGEGSRLRSRDE